jgi:hypothetical protein
MSCRAARLALSAHRDGDLPVKEAQSLTRHLDDCPACRERWVSLNEALDGLAALPRLGSPESISSRIFDRLDMENRQPGLALLFRSFAARRVLATVLGCGLLLEQGNEPLPAVYARTEAWDMSVPPAGTETNPLFLTEQDSMPRARTAPVVPRYLLEQRGEGSVFIETVVARDGSVSAVNVLDGDAADAAPVVSALWRERFDPVRVHGRPVAVSVYRLISRMEVRPPLT